MKMRFLTALVCAITFTLVAAAPVIDLEGTDLAVRYSDPSISRVIVCPPDANGHCDHRVHFMPQTNITAAQSALAMHNNFEHEHGDHSPPHVASTGGFDKKRATVMVCSGTYYTGPCDHPTITEGECKQMTVGSLGKHLFPLPLTASS